METIHNAIKCTQCKNTLESPVLLPCSDSICKKHVKEGEKEYHCLNCDVIHPVPNAGFPHIKALSMLLDQNIQKAKFDRDYMNALDSFKKLEIAVDEMKLLQKDPFYLINKTIGELKRETDITRDEFKLQIDHKADEFIADLENYEQECKRNLDSSDVSSNLEKITKDIDGIKVELNKWQKTLLSFEPKEAEWKVIKEKGKEYKNNLITELDQYKDEFLVRKLIDYQLKVKSFCKIELKSDRK
jgi:hypothetical protein